MPESNMFRFPENMLPFGHALNEAYKKRGIQSLHPKHETPLETLTNNSVNLSWNELIPFGEQFQEATQSLTSEGLFPERLSNLKDKFKQKSLSFIFEAKQKLSKYADNLPKKINEGTNLARQAWCMTKLPLTAISVPYFVGLKGLSPNSSSTNRAYAFSEAGNILSTEYGDEGSERGAFRHILWQSDITSRYDENTAKIIGDCHEYGIPFYPSQKFFNSLADADSAVDQFNNIIGRNIGMKYSHLPTKPRALKILDQMHKDGYYKAVRYKNGYIVRRVNMSDDSYNKMYDEILNRTDENGKAIK